MTCASSLLSCDVLFRIEYKYKVIASLMRWDLHDTFPGKDSYLQACAIASARVISIWVGLPFIFITENFFIVFMCVILTRCMTFASLDWIVSLMCLHFASHVSVIWKLLICLYISILGVDSEVGSRCHCIWSGLSPLLG